MLAAHLPYLAWAECPTALDGEMKPSRPAVTAATTAATAAAVIDPAHHTPALSCPVAARYRTGHPTHPSTRRPAHLHSQRGDRERIAGAAPPS